MAAPIFKDIPNLEGIWSLVSSETRQYTGLQFMKKKNRKLSNDPDEMFELVMSLLCPPQYSD